jgi:hypothetical protein
MVFKMNVKENTLPAASIVFDRILLSTVSIVHSPLTQERDRWKIWKKETS